MVLKNLSKLMKCLKDVSNLQSLFDRLQKKHPKVDRYTFLALLEMFCRNEIDLEKMIQAIKNEIEE